MNLGEVAPTIDALLAMGADELGLRLLPILFRPNQQPRSLSLRLLLEENFPYVYAGDRRGYQGGPYPGCAYEAGIAVIEAWSWLEGQGLLVPTIGLNNTPSQEVRTLSRHAQVLARELRPASTARLLSKEILHPLGSGPISLAWRARL